MIDAGSDIKWSLSEAKLSHKDINALYISHLHADHAGGVEWLGFGSFFDPNRKEKIELYGNGELLRKGWNNSWKGGLESIQGRIMNLDDYFDVNMIRPNGKFYWEGIEFAIVQVVHIINNYAIVPSYGLMMKLRNGKKLFFTCDSQYRPEQLTDFCKEADVIFHDCETLPFKSGVHANYMDLVNATKAVKEKMYLLHYQDNILEDVDTTVGNNSYYRIKDEWVNKAKNDRFKGFIDKGQIIDEDNLFIELK